VIVVAFDPGTKLGWAMRGDSPDSLRSGVVNCAPGRHDSPGVRFVKVKGAVESLLTHAELVVYEDVRRHAAPYAAQIYGGIVAIIQTCCEERGIPFMGAPVGQVKKAATGKGNAKKADMIAAVQERHGLAVEDDNEADAILILDWALGQVSVDPS